MLTQLEFLKTILPQSINYNVGNWHTNLNPTLTTLQAFTELPVVERLSSSHGNEIVIKGFLIGAQDILREYERRNQLTREVICCALNTFIVDQDLKFTSVYMTIMAPNIKIIRPHVLDLSGADAEDEGIRADLGTAGRPGKNGGQAGHLYLRGKRFINLQDLTIQANGGRGGKGQDGGHGADGTPGVDASLEGNVYFTGDHNSVNKLTRVYPVGIGGSCTTTLTHYSLAGTQGQPGLNSQKGGAGGLGGQAGRIVHEAADGYKFEWTGKEGTQGTHGQAGTPGKGGSHGKTTQAVKLTELTHLGSLKPNHRPSAKTEWLVQPSHVVPFPSKAEDGHAPALGDVNIEGREALPPVRFLDTEAMITKYRDYEALLLLNNPQLKPLVKKL